MSYNPPGLMSAAEVQTRSFVQKVYAWMGLGLAVTGACSLYMASDPRMIMALIQIKPLFYGLMIAELGLVVYLSGWVRTMEVGTARFAFLFYSALSGVSLSTIFLVYTGGSIATTFFITAGMFGAISAYGYATKTDLSSVGSFCMMGVLGLVLASLVNWWVKSAAVEWALSYLSILIFVGLTAYDTQRIKAMRANGDDGNLAISGALMLYLDFINLFLSLLRATGRRRD